MGHAEEQAIHTISWEESSLDMERTRRGAMSQSSVITRSSTFASAWTGTAVEDPELAPGTRIGRYEILERLGAGGMGVVYAAIDPDLGRRVALKVARIANGSALEDRLLREAQSLARLDHEHVIRVYEAAVEDGHVFVAMQHVDGVNLTSWLAASRFDQRGWAPVVRMFARVGRALSAVHASGLVHRDFKPDNVMVDRLDRPYLTDFGLACPAGEQGGSPESSGAALEITRTGDIAGTPAFMAPEQYLGTRATPAFDQFAYCVALYRGLFGVPPFAGRTSAELLDNVTAGRLRGQPGEAHGVPASVVRAVLRGLSRPPGRRWPTMDALVRELESVTGVAARVAAGG